MTAAHPVTRAMDSVRKFASLVDYQLANQAHPLGQAHLRDAEARLALAALQLVDAIDGEPKVRRPRGWPSRDLPGPVKRHPATGPGGSTRAPASKPPMTSLPPTAAMTAPEDSPGPGLGRPGNQPPQDHPGPGAARKAP